MDDPAPEIRPVTVTSTAPPSPPTAVMRAPNSVLSTNDITLRVRSSTLIDAVLNELDRFGDRVANFVGLR